MKKNKNKIKWKQTYLTPHMKTLNYVNIYTSCTTHYRFGTHNVFSVHVFFISKNINTIPKLNTPWSDRHGGLIEQYPLFIT